ncbi:MAG: ribosomal-protein-alanine N-acetyltransferase [Planctomycetota bacterium]|nr:MAG: ribosomal-protein-alanine N-acetyltransferase [Planctomycetota bacterium]
MNGRSRKEISRAARYGNSSKYPSMAEGTMATADRQQTGVHIRWMIRRDMPSVLSIEEASFEFPWSEEDFVHCLRQRHCIGMVAEIDDRVVGFMVYELHKNRLHLLNFAVAPDMRRRGVGQAMVEKLVSKLSMDRRNRILLEVRETNLAAQLFFRSAGFRAISVLRDFYEDTTEDAYLMQYRYRPQEQEVSVEMFSNRRMAG